MTNEEVLKYDIPCREKVTIESAINQCEWNIRKSSEEAEYAKGKLEAYVTMLNMLNFLKQDLESGSND